MSTRKHGINVQYLYDKKAMHPVKNDTQVYYFRTKKKEEKVKYSVHLFQSKVIRPLK